MARRITPLIAVALLAFVLVHTARAGPNRAPSGEYVGSQACLECHEDEWQSFRRSVHFQTETGNYPAHGCESCHGPGKAHVEAEGEIGLIFSFAYGEHTAEEKTEQCLSCHGGRETSYRFLSSEHMKGGVDCSTCHKPHQAATEVNLMADSSHKFCLTCHQEIRTAVNLNERHRILEGMVQCTDCHDQHEPTKRTQLAGFKHEKCFTCHTDKQGPFVYEHLSGRVEGCVACHSPHGYTVRHTLFNQSTGELCYSCHTTVPGFHKGGEGPDIRFDQTTICTNCHSSIHGSNINRFFLR